MPAPMRAAAAAAAFALVLAMTGCDRDNGDPFVTPTAAVAASSGGPGTTTAADGATYRAAGLDLCGRTDLEALADLGLTVRRTDPSPPAGRPGAACLFEMRTKAGYEANLRVEASTPETVEEARQLYRGTRGATGMNPVGAVSGLGGEAEAFTKQSAPGFKYAEYMVHARAGNLVVKVWLAVGGKSYVPTSTLEAKTLAIVKATQSAVPTA
ncbi:hypothetical protein [Micromonospora sp. NPDC093277]|uniref:hypothetical protein n=1 Tax=Micromonospora sp. NPDC093277 TaxID=3364291 RepID=UPI00380B0CB3